MIDTRVLVKDIHSGKTGMVRIRVEVMEPEAGDEETAGTPELGDFVKTVGRRISDHLKGYENVNRVKDEHYKPLLIKSIRGNGAHTRGT
jgi:hypothetical protein